MRPRRPALAGLSCVLALVLSGCPEQRLPPGDAKPPDGPDAGRDALVVDSRPDGPPTDGRCRVLLVSVSSTGELANDHNAGPAISRDGKLVAFSSQASNLHPGVTGGVYVRDLAQQTTTLVSVSSTGVPAAGGTAGGAGYSSISADGRYVGFGSAATNLVPGGGGLTTLFRRDRVAGLTEIVALTTTGSPAAGYGWLSGDGRHAVIVSYAADLVPGDTNGQPDIFLRDIAAGTTVRVSVGQDGSQCNGASDDPAISGDGSRVAFTSKCLLVPAAQPAQKDPMVYVWDQDGTLTLVSTSGNEPALNHDGTLVVYSSRRDPNTDLKLPHRNIFVFDTRTHTNTRLMWSVTGGEPDGASIRPAISPNGRYVSCSSMARNLLPQAILGFFDAFLVDRQAGTTELVSVDTQGDRLNTSDTFRGNYTSVADDGSVAFDTTACFSVGGVCLIPMPVYVYQGCD